MSPHIPQDIWDAARTWLQRIDSRDLDECAGIARAILAERQRCAAIAFDYPDSRVGLQHTKRAVVQNDTKWAVVQNVSGNIAAAIRGGTAPIGAAATQSDGGGE